MEEVALKVNEFVSGYNCNESVAAILRKSVVEQSKSKTTPNSYYFVTDLCNPCETYWKNIRPDIKRPPKLMRKLLKGKELHKRASYWLSKLESFSVYEGKIDGIHVGLTGVRGQIDYLLGEQILDLKTKEKIPVTVEEVLANFPQDVEQVAFYSVIHPANPKENYLLFMKDTEPSEIRAFKIITKDSEKIRSIILDRIKKLDFAFENKNPYQLGRSRYHNKTCYLCDNELCNCEELPLLPTEALKLAIEIEYDPVFTKELEDLKNKSNVSSSVFTTWNIIAPREHYKENVLDMESDFERDEEKEEYSLCLRNLVEQLPYKTNLSDKQDIKRSLKESRLYLGQRWLKIPTSGNPKGTPVPYIIKVSSTDDRRLAVKPNLYHMAQLGVMVAAYGKQRGIIFTVYPKIGDMIQVFEVDYSDTPELLKYIKEIIDNLEKAERDKDWSILPPNPPFIKSELQVSLSVK